MDIINLFNGIPKAPAQNSPTIHQHNSLGYRCPEFGKGGMLSVGCSYTYGVGLTQQEMYSEIVASKLHLTNWNLSVIGASNDRISRTLFTSVRVIEPKLCIVCFSFPNRREYFDHSGDVITYGPWAIKQYKNDKKIFVSHLDLINNRYDDVANFIKNYRMVELILNNANINWIWLTVSALDELTYNHVDFNRYCGQMEVVDLAPGTEHPGKETNANTANKVLNKWKTLLCKH